ncbi:MAG TPA: 23S rRNA methyltransferase, partial [Actinomycetota bacterium]|nr:23S rRNA methyltransferase [Actinomycetota bacterium]
RNGVEMHRILRSEGRLLSVTPSADHLGQIVQPLGLLEVDRRKGERVQRALGSLFDLERSSRHSWEMHLRHDEIETLVAMGPSARHIDPSLLSQRIHSLPEPLLVRGDVTLSTWAPR